MKKLILILITGVWFTTLIAGENREFRAIWVVTWEHINRYQSAEENKANVRKILDNIAESNMNVVLWQARQSGTAYYNSSYEPWGYYAGYSDPGYDPLAYAVQEAHKRGLELHAWFNVFQTSSTRSGTPAAEHPEWICTNQDGEPMTSYRSVSPGLQAVRGYTVDVAMEIVNNYDIDGFHLDYVRWNEYDEDDMSAAPEIVDQISKLDGHIDQDKLNRLAKPGGYKRYIYDVEHPYSGGVPDGFSSWDDWRRRGVTEFVRTLHDSIQAVKPWVVLTPAALGKYKAGGIYGWNGYYVVFQDAALWFNEGFVDRLTPMHYHWLDGSSMAAAISSDWEPAIQPGLNAKRLFSMGPGSYRLDEENVWDNHEGIVASGRDLNWTDGYQFFSYASWDKNDYWPDAAELFFTSKSKVRVTYPDSSIRPPAPSISLVKIDSMHYDITITPVQTLNDDYWFAIYRTTGDEADVEQDEIVNLTFENKAFTFNESYVGQRSFKGRYLYYATMLDRFKHESAISNYAEADSMPHFINPPDETDHIYVMGAPGGMLEIHCDSAARAEAYVAYISQDGYTVMDSAVSETNVIPVFELQELKPYYFRTKTRNNAGSSDLSEKLYGGATSAEPHKVLVVNGFDRSTNTRHDYITRYAKSLTDRGYAFSYALNESIYEDRVDLNDFEIVVWMLGDESSVDDTFNPVEQDKVKAFLNNGGKLLVSGAEIGWDLEGKANHPTTADVNFYHNYLKAEYVADAPNNQQATYYACIAIAGGLFDGLSDFSFDNGTNGTIDVDWPDAISPLGGAVSILEYKNAPSMNIAGIAFEGTFPAGTQPGKLIYLAVPFETIYPESKRIELMSKVFDFFEGKISDIVAEGNAPVNYSLQQNYPNPFNPSTTIAFSIAESGLVTLRVYDLLGQKVATVLNRKLSQAKYQVQFDGSNLSSGTYIYELRANDRILRKRMLLIK